MNEQSYSPEEVVRPPVQTVHKSITNGPLLAVLVLVLFIILGGLYYWFTSLERMNAADTTPVSRPTAEQNREPESPTATAQVDALMVVSTSNELEAIEADVEGTNLDSLDIELQAIDAELEAALQGI